jgi:hypothetical protein
MKASLIVDKLLETDEVNPAEWLDQNLPELRQQNLGLQSPINPGDDFTMPHRIVLHHSMSSSPQREEWVVHTETLPKSGEGRGYHWGSYLSDYDQAVAAFRARCAKNGIDWSKATPFTDE